MAKLRRPGSDAGLRACHQQRWPASVSYTLSIRGQANLGRSDTQSVHCRITLAAMADMAGLDEAEQGVVATVLLASYLVTPTMAFSVSGIITVIVSTTLCKGLDYADALSEQVVPVVVCRGLC